ncbi:MAG TPA: multicopper oxidase family protein [Kribbella sp.]
MFEISANLSEVLGGLLFVAWAISGYRLGRLAFRTSRADLRRSARWNLVQLFLNTFVLVAQIVLVAMLWRIDWEFASNRVVLAIPLVLVPCLGVFVLSVPRLWRMAGPASTIGRSEGVEPEDRAAAADPLLVIPVQATAIAGFLDFWVVFIDRPVPPYFRYAVVLWLLLIGSSTLLWLRQRRRQRLAPQEAPRSTLVARGIKMVGALGALGLGILVIITAGAHASRLPDQLDMMSASKPDWGGGPVGSAHAAGSHQGSNLGSHQGSTSVTDLTGPRNGAPDVRFTLTAEEKQLRLTSGAVVDAWTFNGQVPGPELRMHEGDLVEVTLVNRLPHAGVTLHWHGLDVPNAEDGVAGVTQDAVQPGRRFVYRFRAGQVGTFWYHSHQVSSNAVERGLFGPLVVQPRTAQAGLDLVAMAHTWPTSAGRAEAFGRSDTLQRKAVAPGTPVRLRLVNTWDNTTQDLVPRTLSLTGTPYKVAAIDGVDLNRPQDLANVRLEMAIGGRYDLAFTMPAHPVRLTDFLNPSGGVLLSPDGTGDVNPVAPDAPVFDPLGYGEPATTPFTAASRFDRRFRLILDDGPGFFDGHFTFPPTINGEVFPGTPMLMVSEGDLVLTTIVNRGHNDHPMHLHGHHSLVLSRNGKPATGSPWWTDTLNVKPGEIYELAFHADNPGIWMDHCHNLQHAATGMVMHLAYEGVTSPYRVGHATVNQPE